MAQKKSNDIKLDPWLEVINELRPLPPSREDGWRSTSDLRELWGMNRSQMRRAINRLMKRGRVERKKVGVKDYFKLL
jgi:DNA-binding MarR family transcriptional regulator